MNGLFSIEVRMRVFGRYPIVAVTIRLDAELNWWRSGPTYRSIERTMITAASRRRACRFPPPRLPLPAAAPAASRRRACRAPPPRLPRACQ
jgi:hypothetical protein